MNDTVPAEVVVMIRKLLKRPRLHRLFMLGDGRLICGYQGGNFDGVGYQY